MTKGKPFGIHASLTTYPHLALSMALFDLSTHALVVIDKNYKIVDCNPMFKRVYFFYNEELIGRSVQDLLKFPIHQAVAAAFTQPDHDEVIRIEATIFDGLFLPRKVTFLVSELMDNQHYIIEVIDNTETNRLVRAANAIKESQMAMQRSTNEHELMEAVVKVMIDIGHYRFAFIGLLDHDEAQTVVPVAYAGAEEGYLSQIKINLTDESLRNGPSGKAILNKVSSISRNTEIDEAFAPWRFEALKRGYKSMISIPLYYLDQPVIGVINLYSREINAFDTQEVEMLEQMSASLTFGILMRRTQDGLNQTAKELDQSLKKMRRILAQTVGALATTVETRDPYTAGHQRRVTKLAVAIATEMGLKGDQIHEITVAASLHDIGKVTVPVEILSKPGKISAIEMDIIRTHSEAGHNIVKDIEFPWPIAEIVYQHHERMDGSGYPRHLKGSEVLMASRIITVADVVEAMVSHRPYRPGLTLEEALNEIRSKRSSLYDADVVDACLTLFKENRFSFDE
jgi:putative nucleotidyltransferase with HDIG domain/PAS domain S-box-containing protein